jgi:DNA-binding response OmpR family regulator
MPEIFGRILIVDDEPPVLDVLSEYFATQGFAVETASSGAEALSAVKRERPHLVLLDVRMPGMDGVEVLRRLREDEHDIAVIMVTANEDVALARETLKLGAFDYVAKPFDFRYLDRAVAAGLVRAGGVAPSPPPAPAPASASAPADDPWKRLAVAVFRGVRAMTPSAHDSTGARLELAVLDATREARNIGGLAAAQRLVELELLLAIAAEMGDLPTAVRSTIEAAVGAARKTLKLG